MYTIDFLKRECLPAKSRPFKTALFAAIGVALLVGLCLLGIEYFNNDLVLKAKRTELSKVEKTLDNHFSGMTEEKALKKELAGYSECKTEIAQSIDRYVQWTPILIEFASRKPSSLILNELKVLRTVEKEKVTSIKDPKKKVDYEFIHRGLVSDLYDFMPESESSPVEDYLADLRKTETLKDILGKTYIAESENMTLEEDGEKFKVKNFIVNSQLKSKMRAGEK